MGVRKRGRSDAWYGLYLPKVEVCLGLALRLSSNQTDIKGFLTQREHPTYLLTSSTLTCVTSHNEHLANLKQFDH